MAKYKLKDFAKDISVAIKDAQSSPLKRFVGLEHYDSGEPVITRFTDTSLISSSVKEFKENDILIARRNVYLRRAGIAFFSGLTSGDSIILRIYDDCEEKTGIPKEDAIKIIPFILNSNDFWNYANKHADGMNSKRISKDMLYDYEFDLPPLAEQKILADKLWAAYRLKESYKKFLAATDEMVKSQFIEMFGTTENNHKRFPVIAMRDIIESINYGTSKPATEDGSVPYLRMNNITYDGYLDLSEIKHINLSIEEDDKSFVQKGDLMFNRTNTKEFVGKTCVYDQDTPMVIAGYIIRVRFKAGYYSEYVSGYLNSQYGKKRLREMAKGAVHQANINAQEFQSIPILNVPEELQKKYIAIVEQADKSKFELRKSIEAIDAVIKSLINN